MININDFRNFIKQKSNIEIKLLNFFNENIKENTTLLKNTEFLNETFKYENSFFDEFFNFDSNFSVRQNWKKWRKIIEIWWVFNFFWFNELFQWSVLSVFKVVKKFIQENNDRFEHLNQMWIQWLYNNFYPFSIYKFEVEKLVILENKLNKLDKQWQKELLEKNKIILSFVYKVFQKLIKENIEDEQWIKFDKTVLYNFLTKFLTKYNIKDEIENIEFRSEYIDDQFIFKKAVVTEKEQELFYKPYNSYQNAISVINNLKQYPLEVSRNDDRLKLNNVYQNKLLKHVWFWKILIDESFYFYWLKNYKLMLLRELEHFMKKIFWDDYDMTKNLDENHKCANIDYTNYLVNLLVQRFKLFWLVNNTNSFYVNEETNLKEIENKVIEYFDWIYDYIFEYIKYFEQNWYWYSFQLNYVEELFNKYIWRRIWTYSVNIENVLNELVDKEYITIFFDEILTYLDTFYIITADYLEFLKWYVEIEKFKQYKEKAIELKFSNYEIWNFEKNIEQSKLWFKICISRFREWINKYLSFINELNRYFTNDNNKEKIKKNIILQELRNTLNYDFRKKVIDDILNWIEEKVKIIYNWIELENSDSESKDIS